MLFDRYVLEETLLHEKGHAVKLDLKRLMRP